MSKLAKKIIKNSGYDFDYNISENHIEGLIDLAIKENNRPVGRPRKQKTVTPGLRVDRDKWSEVTKKYPKQLNKMFNEWLESL